MQRLVCIGVEINKVLMLLFVLEDVRLSSYRIYVAVSFLVLSVMPSAFINIR